MIKIAIDAMGGDHGCNVLIEGAIEASKKNLELFLVGDKNILNKELIKYNYDPNIIKVVNAEDIISMDEEPVLAFKKKSKSSIIVATKLVKDGLCDAVISAGSTGAQMVSAIFVLGRLNKIKKPAIATCYPTKKGIKILLDAGSVTDCDKENLYQFAKMANFYSKYYFNLKYPKIGLLNIGTEKNKGSFLYKETYKLLENDKNLNFYGNIESRDILKGLVDIVICDGFVGNIVLKLIEGLTESFTEEINKNINKSFIYRLCRYLLMNIFKNIKKKLDYSEYGGAILLGVNGVSVVCHGSSNKKAIKQAIFATEKIVKSNFQKNLTNYFNGE